MNGSVVARLAYKRAGQFHEVASLFWFRSGHAKLRLSVLPIWAIANGLWYHSDFMPQIKVADAPYIDGDIIAKDGDTKLVIGHITCNQSEGDGDSTTYSMLLHAVDVKALVKACEKDKAGLWLNVELV